MDQLPKDLVSMIALKMDIKDVLEWSLTNKYYYESIWNNDLFWMNKIIYDYDFVPNANLGLKIGYRTMYELIGRLYKLIEYVNNIDVNYE